ncbi:MAG: SUMF1/EgtB/PvdO family nonheme iron enzyme [Verrucomicrobiales bacterium]|nr:SUMF1/EgtB/PvdO family nonheme iron enzyme [Verrucomicrobiales bacterium]
MKKYFDLIHESKPTSTMTSQELQELFSAWPMFRGPENLPALKHFTEVFEKYKYALGNLTTTLGTFDYAIKLNKAAIETLMRQALAEAYARERIEFLTEYLNARPPADPAVQLGFNEAREKVERYLNEDFNRITAALQGVRDNWGEFLIDGVRLLLDYAALLTRDLASASAEVKFAVSMAKVANLASVGISIDIVIDMFSDAKIMQTLCAIATLQGDLVPYARWYEDEYFLPKYRTNPDGVRTDPKYKHYLQTLECTYVLGHAYAAILDKTTEVNYIGLNPYEWLEGLVHFVKGGAVEFRAELQADAAKWLNDYLSIRTPIVATSSLIIPPESAYLANGSVIPNVGTTSDKFTFTVEYRDSTGLPAQDAQLEIDGKAFPLGEGVRLQGAIRYSTTPASIGTGAHQFRFIARDSKDKALVWPLSGYQFGPIVSDPAVGPSRVQVDTIWGSDSSQDDRRGGVVDPDYHSRLDFRKPVGSKLWFTAFPDFGWRVDAWMQRYIWNSSPSGSFYYPVDAVQGNSAMIIVREGDSLTHAIVCRFARIDPAKRILRIAVAGPGSTEPSVGSYERAQLDVARVQAKPGVGARLKYWRLDGVEAHFREEIDVEMAQDHLVEAVFEYTQVGLFTNTLPCIEDAAIRLQDSNDNVGVDEASGLQVAHKRSYDGSRPSTWESLFKFDVSSLPSDAVIKSVALRLWCQQVPNREGIGYEVQRNTGPWSELTIKDGTPEASPRFDYRGNGLFNGAKRAYHNIAISERLGEATTWVSSWRSENYGLRVTPSQQMIQSGRDYADGKEYSDDYTFSTRLDSDPQRRPVLMVVYEGQKTSSLIEVFPQEIVLVGKAGTEGASAMLEVRNGGNAMMHMTLEADAQWLAVSGGSQTLEPGRTNSWVVSAVLGDQAPGEYQGSLTIRDPDAANGPVQVPVRLRILGPTLEVVPGSLRIVAKQGGSVSANGFEIRNGGFGTLGFSLSHTSKWMAITPSSGVSTNQAVAIGVVVDVTGLAPGTYSEDVRVVWGAGQVGLVPVVLEVVGIVSAPVFDPVPSMFPAGNVQVKVECATSGAVVRYTLDGSRPTETSPIYNGMIVITNTTEIRARAWRDGLLPSSELAGTYVVGSLNPVLGFQRGTGAVILSWTRILGNYVLEFSDRLQNGIWRKVNVEPVVVAGQLQVTEGHLSESRFYRLRLVDGTASEPNNPDASRLVWVPAGSFAMGSPDGEAGRSANEGPVTRVAITHGYWISKFEVTQREYFDLMRLRPSQFVGDSSPVEGVSWKDATNYCAQLTASEKSAGRLPAGYRYRLPTEAEWEYACRAGSESRFSYGDDDGYTMLGNYAWYGNSAGNSQGTTHPVGSRLPNRFGLYDMHGNVWEHCGDVYAASLPGGSLVDWRGPDGPNSAIRVIRGGGWVSDGSGDYCRSAARLEFGWDSVNYEVGFRVALAAEN